MTKKIFLPCKSYVVSCFDLEPLLCSLLTTVDTSLHAVGPVGRVKKTKLFIDELRKIRNKKRP